MYLVYGHQVYRIIEQVTNATCAEILLVVQTGIGGLYFGLWYDKQLDWINFKSAFLNKHLNLFTNLNLFVVSYVHITGEGNSEDAVIILQQQQGEGWAEVIVLENKTSEWFLIEAPVLTLGTRWAQWRRHRRPGRKGSRGKWTWPPNVSFATDQLLHIRFFSDDCIFDVDFPPYVVTVVALIHNHHLQTMVQFDTLQHYGAVCCYSCRAFFRRGITRSYVCVRGDDLCQVDLCHSKFITIYIAFNHRSTASHGPIASDVDTQGAWLLVWNQSWWTPPLSANRSAPCLVMWWNCESVFVVQQFKKSWSRRSEGGKRWLNSSKKWGFRWVLNNDGLIQPPCSGK